MVRNKDKIALSEIAIILSFMDVNSKYIWAINNIDIDVTKDIRSTGIKKHWRLAGQIEKDVNGLYKD